MRRIVSSKTMPAMTRASFFRPCLRYSAPWSRKSSKVSAIAWFSTARKSGSRGTRSRGLDYEIARPRGYLDHRATIHPPIFIQLRARSQKSIILDRTYRRRVPLSSKIVRA
jgi:hypothetical protein